MAWAFGSGIQDDILNIKEDIFPSFVVCPYCCGHSDLTTFHLSAPSHWLPSARSLLCPAYSAGENHEKQLAVKLVKKWQVHPAGVLEKWENCIIPNEKWIKSIYLQLPMTIFIGDIYIYITFEM